MVFNKRITEGNKILGLVTILNFKALELRKKATPQERILWEKLRRKQ
jgi:very-short-patch-repair endonuclease